MRDKDRQIQRDRDRQLQRERETDKYRDTVRVSVCIFDREEQ